MFLPEETIFSMHDPVKEIYYIIGGSVDLSVEKKIAGTSIIIKRLFIKIKSFIL